MDVWRIYFKDKYNDRTEYCLNNNLAAMGWSLPGIPQNERENIKTYEDWEKAAAKVSVSSGAVKRFANEVKTGDIIWCRNKGKYYIARVEEDSRWIFNAGKDALSIDVANQFINLRWKEISEFSDELSVPGAISTAFIKGSTFQRIKKAGVMEFSKISYNRISGKKIYEEEDIKLTRDVFYNMLQPSDVEDLLCMWLYAKHKYICVPSTNKLATPLYECVLVDPYAKEQKHIYIQVKKGEENLYVSSYRDLKGEVFLLTTQGKVIYDEDSAENIKEVSPDDLYEFALNDDDYNALIPENIRTWVKFITRMQNEKINNKVVKGIMFDTNRSYSEMNEREMIDGGYVAAYGAAKRYVERFSKDDYVLYYSKGKGVFAVGQVISEETEEIGDSLRRKVRLVAPVKLPENAQKYKYISAKEIRNLVLKCNFYFRSTIKVPYLTKSQTEQMIEYLNKKYEKEK